MSIFEAHFRRLHARYGAGQTHELQMQEIAAIFGCSVRNCRIALKNDASGKTGSTGSPSAGAASAHGSIC